MSEKRDISTLCVIVSETDNSDLIECRIIDPVRKLMALDPSIAESERFDLCLPVMQAICEYARLDTLELNESETVVSVAEATIKAIHDQLQGINIDAEMLRLRKRALKRRIRVLERLTHSMKSDDDNPMTA